MSETLLSGRLEETYEHLIQGLLNQGFGVCQDLFDESTIISLRENLLNHHAHSEMHPAGIGRKFDHQKNAEVRGDVIKWIDRQPTHFAEQILMSRIQEFVDYLNRTCYTSINDFEFHYAYYAQGSFYKRHLDQFKSDKGRKFSFVIYLNDNWLESDGGHLSLYGVTETRLSPIAGRIVFFKSDEVEHEVHVSPTRARLSIAGWLKSV